MAGTGNFYRMAVRASGIHALQIGTDNFVSFRHHVPAGVGFPRRIGNVSGEHRSVGWHLRMRFKIGLRGRQVGSEIAVIILWCNGQIAIGRAGKRMCAVGIFFTVAGLGFTVIRRMGGNVDQTCHLLSLPASLMIAPP